MCLRVPSPLQSVLELCLARASLVRECPQPLSTCSLPRRLREERRRVDWLECRLSLVRALLFSTSSILNYAGCYMLWNSADKKHEHHHITDPMIEQLCALLRSSELRVNAIATAVLWSFAQHKEMIHRIPIANAIPALLSQLRTEEEAVTQQDVRMPSQLLACLGFRSVTIIILSSASRSSTQ